MQEYVPEPKPRFDAEQVRVTVEGLIDVCRDGEQGYAAAAHHVKDPSLKEYFHEQKAERGRYAEELKQSLEDYIGKWESTRQGSVGGAARFVWLETKAAAGASDESILASVEAGEDAAKESYMKALNDPELPAVLRGLVRGQAQAVIAAHDHIKLLRDHRKAA